MIGLAKGKPPYEIVEGVNEGELNSFLDWVQFCMLYSACELHPFLMPACKKPKQNTYLEFQEYLKIQLQIG